MAGPSTYPFCLFRGAFAEALPLRDYPWRPAGDTLVGHDVWIGMEALVMPGVRIGHGAVIGAGSVVTRDVPDYAVVAGNPARVVRRRYAEDEAARLVALAWWDWPVARIAQAVPLLVKGSVAALEDFAAP
jgi:virginiamycin A acetyltransferase